jgi:tellurite resistance protein TerC
VSSSRRTAVLWTVLFIVAALVFGAGIWIVSGAEPAQEYFTVYLLEKSLSIDNLFVFVVLFRGLAIPRPLQRRVLSWGILGALVARALFIVAGAELLARWQGAMYVFGGILLLTAGKLALPERAGAPPEGQRLVRFLSRHLPVTHELHDGRFFVRDPFRVTPLFVALLAVELTDVLFALDSIPAAFAVSQRPLVIYAANIFAVLGLRSIYMLLSDALTDLHYLKHGLAAVLALAGLKMVLHEVVEIPPLVSLGVVVAVIGVSVLASLARRGRVAEQQPR